METAAPKGKAPPPRLRLVEDNDNEEDDEQVRSTTPENEQKWVYERIGNREIAGKKPLLAQTHHHSSHQLSHRQKRVDSGGEASHPKVWCDSARYDAGEPRRAPRGDCKHTVNPGSSVKDCDDQKYSPMQGGVKNDSPAGEIDQREVDGRRPATALQPPRVTGPDEKEQYNISGLGAQSRAEAEEKRERKAI